MGQDFLGSQYFGGFLCIQDWVAHKNETCIMCQTKSESEKDCNFAKSIVSRENLNSREGQTDSTTLQGNQAPVAKYNG